jgi:hypothetical protein
MLTPSSPPRPHKRHECAGGQGGERSIVFCQYSAGRYPAKFPADRTARSGVTAKVTFPTLSSRRLALISGFALLGVLGGASICGAESPWRRRSAPPPPPPYRVSLEALDGSSLPTFQQAGTPYVLGEPGERYNIRVQNPTDERVEVVVTVDGRDAVSGDIGDYVSQRGYLIEPWGSLLVEGFRRSLDEVAAFRFSGKGQSYSARRGTPQHVGVIGVAVFSEKPHVPAPVWRPRRRYAPESEYRPAAPRSTGADKLDGAGAAPRAESAPSEAREASQDDARRRSKRATPGSSSGSASGWGRAEGPSNIGTEYGERESSSVVEVAFERRSPTHPVAVLRVRYDDYDGLEARGIDLSSLGYAYRDEPEPEAFPYSQSRFAPPPRY